MPAPWGIVPSGFNIKTQSEILTEMQQVALQEISPNLDLQPPDPIAVLLGIGSGQFSDLWELALALYNGMDPDQATDDQLTSLSLITGTPREPATSTLVNSCTIVVTSAVSFPAGTMFASIAGQPTNVFTNTGDFTTLAAGTVTGVEFVCLQAGPIPCNAGTLTVISVPLSGWSSITNTSKGLTGSNIQTDSSLRQTRQQELEAAGTTSAAAIQAAILREMNPAQSPLTIPFILSSGANSGPSPGSQYTNPYTITSQVTGVTVLSNDTNATDGNGLPAHSLEAIAYAGGTQTAEDDAALAALIQSYKSAGISTNPSANTVQIVIDTQGTSEAIHFTRPVAVPIYVSIAVKYTGTLSQSTITEQIQDAIAAFAASNWLPGVEVYALETWAQIFNTAQYPQLVGVVTYSSAKIDTVSPPVASSDIPITIRQIAVIANKLTDITVTYL